MTISILWIFLFFGGIAAVFAFVIRHGMRQARENKEKQEALFASMFPDLQPYYHPKSILEFVRARLAQPPAAGGMTVPNPPGFAVPAAEVDFREEKGKLREIWRLLDAQGRELSQFRFDTDEKDAMVRVGQGKFRVSRVQDRVRYWHPDREFKWVPPAAWTFVTPMAETPFQSDDRGSLGFSDSSSSSTAGSTTAGTAVAAVGLAAAAGTFDGGGASAAWDGAGGGAAASGSGSESETAGATSY